MRKWTKSPLHDTMYMACFINIPYIHISPLIKHLHDVWLLRRVLYDQIPKEIETETMSRRNRLVNSYHRHSWFLFEVELGIELSCRLWKKWLMICLVIIEHFCDIFMDHFGKQSMHMEYRWRNASSKKRWYYGFRNYRLIRKRLLFVWNDFIDVIKRFVY